MDIIEVTAPGPDLDAVRDLFLEYAGALNFDLCFQDFESEFEGLPGVYAALVPRLQFPLKHKKASYGHSGRSRPTD